jgi:hypothetical protein
MESAEYSELSNVNHGNTGSVGQLIEQAVDQTVDQMEANVEQNCGAPQDLDALSETLPPLEVMDVLSANVTTTNETDAEQPPLVVDPPAEEETGPVFVPFNTTAKKRISNMLVQIVSAMRHEVALGSTLESSYETRLTAVEDNAELDAAGKESARIILKQAYETAKTLPVVDKENKQEMGALAVLASGLMNMSDAMSYGNPGKRSTKRVKTAHSKKTIAQRKKNKVANVSRKKNRK